MSLDNTPYDDAFRTLLNDCSMLIRFFEYDTQIALDSGAIRKNLLSVTLPHSAVLFLLCNAATPDTMQIEILTPDIPVMKSQHYTIEEIFEKNLLFLIPFYIFTHEEYFDKYDKNIVQLARLESKYQYIISTLS